MPTEDHPLEYAKFEGVIPEGEYGGGTVMIWDRGTWEPEVPDVDAARTRGELKFRLNGAKLSGTWVLVRIRGRQESGRPVWLLMKHRDEVASGEDIAETRPHSVVSGRLLVEIARDEGGNVERAADGDPEWALRELMRTPGRLTRRKRGPKAVWHSTKSFA
jgi:bifunctional non-homologous end joining protein LigD